MSRELDLESALATLQRIVAEFGSHASFHAALKALLRTLAERHDFLRPHLVIYDPQARSLRLCLADSPARAAGEVYAPGAGITGRVFTLGRTVIVDRISESTVFQNKFFMRSPEEMERLSFICAPVYASGGDPLDGQDVVGTLSADIPHCPRERLERYARFLELVAALIGSRAVRFQEELTRKAPAVEERETLPAPGPFFVSRAMSRVREQALQAAESRCAVILVGEEGVGRQSLAELIHKKSGRAGLFVPLDCASLPPARLKEELFGRQKGAGAPHSVKGLFESAHKGSVFLESLEACPPEVQRALAVVMQTQEVRREGAERPVRVDARIFCSCTASAPDAPLELEPELAEEPALRIFVPPLRERREDIPLLADFFLRNAAGEQGRDIRRLSPAAAELLLRWSWPGNVRELKACMEQAATRCAEEVVRSRHLPLAMQSAETAPEKQRLAFSEAVEQYEKELLADALLAAGGNVLQASRMLDASYRVIHYKVKKYGLNAKKNGTKPD